MTDKNTAALEFLATRLSQPARMFNPPVPSRDELTAMLQLALRVPDHGKLEPWRLIVLEKPDFTRLADLAEARAKEMGADAEKLEKGRGQYDRGHLAVVVISTPKASDKIPVEEQVLSAGALCMSLLSVATASGWGANWLSGWPAHDAVFRARAFGCQGAETVAGIIHIGTAAHAFPDRPRPDPARVVQWGLGPA